MAFGKIFAFFLVFVAFSASSEAASLKDTIPELIEQAILAITGMLKNIISTLEDYITKFGEDASGIENSVLSVVTAVMDLIDDTFNSKVEELGDQLDANGVTLYNCFVANRNESNARLLSFFTTFFECANPSLVTVVSSMSGILDTLQTTDENVENLATGLEDCSETDVSCMLTVTIGIINELSQLPTNLDKPIADFMAAVNSVRDTLADCATKGSDEWYIEFFEGIGILQQCACGSRK